MDKKNFIAQKKFIQDFFARVDDEVECVEMCELRASGDSLSKMHLALNGGEGIWGMIVICKKSVYFYAPRRSLALMAMIHFGGDEAEIEEQIFCFNNLQDLKFIASPKKWFQIFSQEKIEFSFLQEGRRVCGEFFLSKNAIEILIKIRATLNL
uniref:YokE-like PH domain-containing protein n=1 Tax=uncultured Spirochaetaceae bacterium TaxID=201186 RepID=A0A650EQD5_9SPIO|nr:hypothetical protein Unknown280_2000 [uncultured Spirochaetaceae bacterium]